MKPIKFRTEIHPEPANFSIGHEGEILLLGSCFSEHMTHNLRRNLFRVVENPFGTSYNPVSLAGQIRRIVSGKLYAADELNQHDGLYFSFDHHTFFSHLDTENCLNHINTSLQNAHESLPRTKLLTLTLGTAHAWKLKSSGQIVNNCHRLPGSDFDRVLLSPESIVKELEPALLGLQSQHPKIRVILTVSPVRHLRDGAILNQRSKAALILAAHQLAEALPRTYYFPAYELMMDDLRDYRFYTEDLLHPNPQAVEYIWQQFCKAVISKESQAVFPSAEKVQRFIAPRPRQPESEQYQMQVKQMISTVEKAKSVHPSVEWTAILDVLSTMLDKR